MAQAGGALSIAITNNPDSPLSDVADHTLNLHAGPELSVAATKTFVNSAVAGIWLFAEWAGDETLLAAIHDLPSKLRDAVSMDWADARAVLGGRNSIFCLGRGPAYAISNEAALKFRGDLSNPRGILFFSRGAARTCVDRRWRISRDRFCVR